MYVAWLLVFNHCVHIFVYIIFFLIVGVNKGYMSDICLGLYIHPLLFMYVCLFGRCNEVCLGGVTSSSMVGTLKVE